MDRISGGAVRAVTQLEQMVVDNGLDQWIPWKLGDPVPPPGEYVVTARDAIELTWTALCRVQPADRVFADRFDWPYASTIVAYIPRQLPVAFKA